MPCVCVCVCVCVYVCCLCFSVEGLKTLIAHSYFLQASMQLSSLYIHCSSYDIPTFIEFGHASHIIELERVTPYQRKGVTERLLSKARCTWHTTYVSIRPN